VKKIEDFNAEDRIDVKLLEKSVHFLSGQIDEESALKTIKWIVYENTDSKQEKLLTLYVNSSGGELYQAFAIIDAMRSSRFPIRTIGLGQIMSAAFLIFACGTKGERYIAPNTGIMCHQFTDSIENKYHDIRSAMKEAENSNDRMLAILEECTGLPKNRIKTKLLGASDTYLTAEEMVELGAADHLLAS
jgi:ATP-dependent Clp protease protease subunit